MTVGVVEAVPAGADPQWSPGKLVRSDTEFQLIFGQT